MGMRSVASYEGWRKSGTTLEPHNGCNASGIGIHGGA